MNPLEERLNYKFRNPLLLAEALTHPSLGYETQRHHFDNQRLEFLGDAVLQLIFTEHLFQLFPKFGEGQLTKLRARLVSREGLQIHAIRLRIGEYIMMGRGEEASGGRERASSLADAFEALIGAIYLDSDFYTAKKIVLSGARDVIEALSLDPIDVNPKGRLQELLQSLSPAGPTYRIVSQRGPEHHKVFKSEVLWNGEPLGSGTGKSKRLAEIDAAKDALKRKLWIRVAAEASDALPAEEAS